MEVTFLINSAQLCIYFQNSITWTERGNCKESHPPQIGHQDGGGDWNQ